MDIVAAALKLGDIQLDDGNQTSSSYTNVFEVITLSIL